MEIVQRVANKARETDGNIMVTASVILLAFSMLLTVCLEGAHVWTTCDVIKAQTNEAVLAVAAINVENVYNGVRESVGQARAVNAAGTEWAQPVATEEVADIMVANMGFSQQGSALAKYTDSGAAMEYALYDFQTRYDNAESGLNFTTTFDVVIPLKIGTEILPPIRVHMEIKSTYEQKF